jgi:hypothetical protein
MSRLDELLDVVKDQLGNRGREGSSKSRGGGLLGKLGNILTGNRARASNPRDVRPASEDPYGDPADEKNFGGRSVKPASQDPYGDPADEPRRRR